jgi:hypothetical protein
MFRLSSITLCLSVSLFAGYRAHESCGLAAVGQRLYVSSSRIEGPVVEVINANTFAVPSVCLSLLSFLSALFPFHLGGWLGGSSASIVT